MASKPAERVKHNVCLKIDEDLSPELVPLFGKHGYAAATVHQQGWAGVIDAVLWPRVQREWRMLLTADVGFGDLRAYPPGSHAGIVLFRADRESVVAYLSLAEVLLAAYDLNELVGCVVVVSPRSIRIRRPNGGTVQPRA